jgi:ATP-binding cassette, subfamily G (WHITE), member 2, SNQ2
VTDPNGRIPREVSHPLPRTAIEFAEYYRKSSVAEKNREDMELYHSEYVSSTDKKNEYRRSVLMEHAKHVREGSPYVVSLPMQVRVHLPHCIRMEVRGLTDVSTGACADGEAMADH